MSQIRFLLKELCFEYVWLQQGVENDQLFLEIFQSRVKELYYNKWRHGIENSSKLSIYLTFKNSLEWEVYLNIGIIKMSKLRAALTRFRCSSHVFNIEMSRRNGILLEGRLCAFCENNRIVVIEDEYHFLLHCPRYNNIRKKYLKKTSGAI